LKRKRKEKKVQRKNEQIKVCKILGCIDMTIDYIIRIFGIFIVFYILNFLGKNIFDLFPSEYLFSLVIIPIIDIIKYYPTDFAIRVSSKIFLHEDFIESTFGINNILVDKLFLNNIENIERRKTIFSSIFGYETIRVSGIGNHVDLICVKNPQYLIDKIKVYDKK